MKPISEPEALNKAAAYCTLCERCVNEVKTKLTLWGIDTVAQKCIIERLETEGFIDENRYCHAFVNDKLKYNRWGRIKIKAALREKHLPQQLITDAIEEIDETEYCNILNSIIASKRKELKNSDNITAKQKLLRFAASRGFELSLIMQAIKFNPDEMD